MLRNVLSSLETKQQAIILGHAVLAVVIRTREYDFEFMKDMTMGFHLVEILQERGF